MEERSWLNFIRDELEPYPQRLSGTLRDTLSITLAVILVMTLRINSAAIGIYYIFLLTRQTPSLSLISALRNLGAVCAGVGTCLLMIQITDNEPMARVIGLIICMTVTGFMLAASSLAAEAAAFSLFWFTTLAGWDAHRPAEYTVQSSLWVIAATALSVACAIAVEFVFGSKTLVANLNEEMDGRLLAVEQIFSLYAQGADETKLRTVRRRIVIYSHAGQQRMQRVYERIIERNLRTLALPAGTRVRIPMLADLMDLASAFALDYRNGVDDTYRSVCEEIASLCAHTREGATSEESPYEAAHTDDLLGRIRQTLHDLNAMPPANIEPENQLLMTPLPSSKQPIFSADAFTNPQHFYFGVKLAAAATICYVFYNAVGWPGLATSVITVLITGVSTTAAMKQKQLFRMLGAVLGGALGIISVSFFFPHMDSITTLIILVGCVTFASAWMARSPRTSYVGMQTALAFYLVVFQSFDAPVVMAPARDRVVGVGLGLLAMWFIFDQLWPIRTSSAMRLGFASLLRETGQLFRVCAEPQSKDTRIARANELRYSVGLTVFRLREMHEAVTYEFGSDREMHMIESEKIMQASIATAALFWSGLATLTHKTSDDPAATEATRLLGERLQHIAQLYELPNLGSIDTVQLSLDSGPLIGSSLRGSMARYHELCEILPAP